MARNKNAKVFKTKNERLQLKFNCSVRGKRKSQFISKGSGIFSSLGIRTPLSKIPGVNILFKYNRIIKMNKANSIINKFLLAGDKFMHELHLVDPIIKKYCACGPFTKHTKRTQDFLNTGNLSYIYKNDLDKACFLSGCGFESSCSHLNFRFRACFEQGVP